MTQNFSQPYHGKKEYNRTNNRNNAPSPRTITDATLLQCWDTIFKIKPEGFLFYLGNSAREWTVPFHFTIGP